MPSIGNARTASGNKSRTIVFLDRDGVINRYPGHGDYVTRVRDFRFIPGVKAALRTLTRAGCALFVISNQAGVGRGIFTQKKLELIDRKLHRGVNASGGRIIKSFYCTHHPDEGCACRKPKIASIIKARRMVKGKAGFFVGDTDKDMEAGRKAGCVTILVLSGRDGRKQAARWSVKPDHIVATLKEACGIILHEDTGHPRDRGGRA